MKGSRRGGGGKDRKNKNLRTERPLTGGPQRAGGRLSCHWPPRRCWNAPRSRGETGPGLSGQQDGFIHEKQEPSGPGLMDAAALVTLSKFAGAAGAARGGVGGGGGLGGWAGGRGINHVNQYLNNEGAEKEASPPDRPPRSYERAFPSPRRPRRAKEGDLARVHPMARPYEP